MKKVISIIVLVVMLFCGCDESSPATNTDDSVDADRTVLTISIEFDSERTITPDISMDVVSWDISGAGPDSDSFSVSDYSEYSLTKDNLTPGTWDITIDGKNDESIIASGTGSCDIVDGESTSISISVTSLAGNGSLSLGFSWTYGDITCPIIEGTITDTNSNSSNLEFLTDFLSSSSSVDVSSLENGYYSLAINVRDGSETIYSLIDTVRILTDEETSVEYDLSLESSFIPLTDELFDGSDEPEYAHFITDDEYYFLEPWNYNSDENGDRLYPLLIYLHPYGQGWLPWYRFDTDDFKQKFPCFSYVPLTSEAAGSWSDSTEIDVIIAKIEEIKNTYRIDTNRIYLIGYSMGGSGSYVLANSLYDYNNQLFAGIIRQAGASESVVRDEIAERSSIWVQYSADDFGDVLTYTGGAYEYLRNYYSELDETTEDVDIIDHSGTIYTLTKDSIQIVKKSLYVDDGHAVQDFPYNDSYLLEWLFSQSLEKRP